MTIPDPGHETARVPYSHPPSQSDLRPPQLSRLRQKGPGRGAKLSRLLSLTTPDRESGNGNEKFAVGL